MEPECELVINVGEMRRILANLPDSALVGFATSRDGTLASLRTVAAVSKPGLLLLLLPEGRRARLFDVVAENDVVAAKSLLLEGADVNARDPRSPLNDGATALTIAAETGAVEVLRLLLAQGADIDARSASGWTPLMRACNAGQVETARALLEAGADPELRNAEGYSAFGRIPGDCAELLQLFEDRRTGTRS